MRKCADHEGIVNSVAVAKSNPYIFASGSDDCSVKLWDSRVKAAIQSIEHEYQITSVCISPDGETIYSGGIDNIIRRWDVKADTGVSNLTLLGHADTITGLALSPDGTSLLSNAMDSTLRKWDVRPFTPAESRCVLHYDGVHHGAEKGLLRCAWSKDGELVTCGSADRYRFIIYFTANFILCIIILVHYWALFVAAFSHNSVLEWFIYGTLCQGSNYTFSLGIREQ